MKRFHQFFWVLAAVGLVLDQGSKYEVFQQLYNQGKGGEIVVIPGAFNIVAHYTNVEETGKGILARLRTISGKHIPEVNHGALFGIGGRNDKGQDLNRLFAIVSVVAAVLIITFSSKPVIANDFFLSFALGLILAGTLGNLYDRIVFDGVRDFLHWYYAVNWPVFNIADCCLVCGATTLLLHAFFVAEQHHQTTPVQAETVHAVDGQPSA